MLPACPPGAAVLSQKGPSSQNSRNTQGCTHRGGGLFKIVPYRIKPKPSELTSRNGSSVQLDWQDQVRRDLSQLFFTSLIRYGKFPLYVSTQLIIMSFSKT